MSTRDPSTGSPISPADAPSASRETIVPGAPPEPVTAPSPAAPNTASASNSTRNFQTRVLTHVLSPSGSAGGAGLHRVARD